MSGDLMLPLCREIDLPGGKRSTVLTSFDPSTKEGRVKLFKVLNADFISSDDVLDSPLAVVDVVCYPDTFVDKDSGETLQVTRSVLVLADGKMVSTTSGGVYKSIVQYCTLCSAPPWNPPVTFVICETKTRNNRPYRYLSVAD